MAVKAKVDCKVLTLEGSSLVGVIASRGTDFTSETAIIEIGESKERGTVEQESRFQFPCVESDWTI